MINVFSCLLHIMSDFQWNSANKIIQLSKLNTALRLFIGVYRVHCQLFIEFLPKNSSNNRYRLLTR